MMNFAVHCVGVVIGVLIYEWLKLRQETRFREDEAFYNEDDEDDEDFEDYEPSIRE